MEQVTVIYLSAEQMGDLYDEIYPEASGSEEPEWDGISDITLSSVEHVVFRKSGTIE